MVHAPRCCSNAQDCPACIPSAVSSATRSMHCVAEPRLPLAMAPCVSLIVVASAAVLLLLALAAAERNLLQFPGEDCAVGTKPTVIPESQRCGGDRNGCCQVPGHLLVTPDAKIMSNLKLHSSKQICSRGTPSGMPRCTCQ